MATRTTSIFPDSSAGHGGGSPAMRVTFIPFDPTSNFTIKKKAVLHYGSSSAKRLAESQHGVRPRTFTKDSITQVVDCSMLGSLQERLPCLQLCYGLRASRHASCSSPKSSVALVPPPAPPHCYLDWLQVAQH